MPLPIARLTELLDQDAAPREFWSIWLNTGLLHLGAELALLYVREPTAEPGQGWSLMQLAPDTVAASGDAPAITSNVGEALIIQALAQGVAVGEGRAAGWRVGLLHLKPASVARELLLCVHVAPGRAADLSAAALGQLALAARGYEIDRERRRLERDAVRLGESLEILGRVLQAETFQAAALALANELSERYGCEQVALAWVSGDGLKLRAVSHSEKLDRKSELTALLEEAGQEALIQRREIVHPGQTPAYTRAHQAYADAARPGNLLSLPLVVGDTPLGAVVCERQSAALSQSEQWSLRMLCDQVTRPLRDLEAVDRPLWKRLGRELHKSLPRQLRPATAEGRRFTRQIAIAVAVVLLCPIPYRVDAPVIIKTDSMAFLGAPFDGYIESSPVTLGAKVKTGDILFSLSTRELLLEQAAGLADTAQYAREVEKRRAANQLAEMSIAEAQLEQARAKLQQVEYRLANAQVATPIAGVVVEGEPGKNLGGAVKRGENVIKVAAVERLYAEINVAENDIQDVAPGQDASITLVANPAGSWDMSVKRVIPAPAVKEGVNAFPVRAEPVGPHPAWWRPGMTGVAKVSVGWRNLLWIASHRLVDYLRLHLWI